MEVRCQFNNNCAFKLPFELVYNRFSKIYLHMQSNFFKRLKIKPVKIEVRKVLINTHILVTLLQTFDIKLR